MFEVDDKKKLVTNKSNCTKNQKLKLWQNSSTQIVTKLKNSNVDQTQTLKLSNSENILKSNGKIKEKLLE